MTDMARDIASRVQTAYQANTPLNITGAGSKSFLGRVSPDATLLDVKGHSGIIEYDPFVMGRCILLTVVLVKKIWST